MTWWQRLRNRDRLERERDAERRYHFDRRVEDNTDIGVPEPEEELAKAQLASRIREIVRRSRLTQVAAAGVMGIDQPKVSALLNGRLSSFSSERLMRLLTRLGQDVEIVVKSKPRRRQCGRIRVVEEARA